MLLKNKKLHRVIGSDSHDPSISFYENIDFFKINSKEFINLMKESTYGKN